MAKGSAGKVCSIILSSIKQTASDSVPNKHDSLAGALKHQANQDTQLSALENTRKQMTTVVLSVSDSVV